MRYLFVFIPLFLFSCAAAPQLADYPRREIDRPFTLPKGVATWSTLGLYGVERYRFSDGTEIKDEAAIPVIPLTWRQALSDDWNLLWSPIPIGVTYQIRNDAEATTGLQLGYGLRLSNSGNSSMALVAGYSHRQKLNSDFALELQPTLTPWFHSFFLAAYELRHYW